MELVALLQLLVLASVSGKSHVHRRGIRELAGATRCATNGSPLAYVSYGCYCGFGGKGWPRDQTDWCCHKHDSCYEKTEAAGCSPKLQPYNWECKDRKVECGVNQSKCQKMMCECDKEIARCFAKADYNVLNVLFPGKFCGKIHQSVTDITWEFSDYGYTKK